MIELRGGKLAGHSRRVADLARTLAKKMGMSDGEIQEVVLAGLLHDIGKIGLPDKLLEKPFSSLTTEERVQVMKHPQIGQAALMALDKLKGVAEMICAHHERFDGMGYPNALEGPAIPLGARILAVANEYDAFLSGTLLNQQVSLSKAREYIVVGSGKRYDPAVVAVFTQVLGGDGARQDDADLAQQIRAANLKPGMILARDLVAPNGMLLLPHDRVLDNFIIEKLLHFQHQEGHELVLWIKPEA